MALAPTLNRKRGLFGSQPMQQTLPTVAGGGMFGGGEPPAVAAAAPDEPRKPSFFGEGGVGRAIAGNIGDFLLQYSGMDPIYQPAMQQRQALQQQEARRQSALADWVWKQRYEDEHPKPANNDTVADYNFYKEKLSPDQFKTWLQNKVDPPQYRQGADGQFYRINVAPPPSISEDDWDSGAPVNGGPSPSATGGFHR